MGRQGPQHPLTADLAGVLETARQDRADGTRRFFASLFRVGWLSGRSGVDEPLDSGAAVRLNAAAPSERGRLPHRRLRGGHAVCTAVPGT